MKYSHLLHFLRSEQYQEVEQIHQSADFYVRGDTITVWLVSEAYPLRFEFFGESLEKISQKNSEEWKIVAPRTFDLNPNTVTTNEGKVRPSEYVVHPFHGIGIFRHRQMRQVESDWRAFIVIEYAGNDMLYFPSERESELMPYIGSRHPRLTRLYSQAWKNTKEKIQKNLIGIARELLQMYTQRSRVKREPYSVIRDWEQQIAKTVDFSLTEDQERALTDIAVDFSRPFPMDRLICGDVGFGKTEVAIRAAIQVLASGKQVAFIAPTTVLAEQHYEVIKKRFQKFPIITSHMSRGTKKDDSKTIEKIGNGEVDIVVGTHRVLGKDISFKNLGLLIIDEEQKFGVSQKEWLKKMRPNIDVLALSATPIPRSLSLSLSGLRSLSILRSAPTGRLPVQTTVSPYSDNALGALLKQEVKRGGQVYVVHNRVQSLPSVIDRVQKILIKNGCPDALVAPAHGQMDQEKLVQTFHDFFAGKIQVLVATSIVEHGLDSPTANSLAVLHSEWFGLSDLYQLRGRVGRRRTQAYATFFTGGIERVSDENLQVGDIAKKRLDALLEADELGSGWSIAVRDLEIRGGGNILGHEQHGNMESIGLLLYSQLLQEEIGRQASVAGIPLFQNSARLE